MSMLGALRARLVGSKPQEVPDAKPAKPPAPKARLAAISENASAIIAEVREASLTYCGPPKLETLARCAEIVNEQKIRGQFLEAGVALGGSAIVMARLKGDRRLVLYDVFGLIPPPSERDGEDAHKRFGVIAKGESVGLGGNTYYGYVQDLQRQVSANLERFGVDLLRDEVKLVAGLFADTLKPIEPVALAHVDCDWYDSVTICIDRIAPMLAPGGIIVFDDYTSYSGCRKAVDQWLAHDSRLEVIAIQRSIAIRRC